MQICELALKTPMGFKLPSTSTLSISQRGPVEINQSQGQAETLLGCTKEVDQHQGFGRKNSTHACQDVEPWRSSGRKLTCG